MPTPLSKPTPTKRKRVFNSNNLEDDQQQEDGGAEFIWKIVGKTTSSIGLEDSFTVELIGGSFSRLQRTRSQLAECAPNLLQLFEQAELNRNPRALQPSELLPLHNSSNVQPSQSDARPPKKLRRKAETESETPHGTRSSSGVNITRDSKTTFSGTEDKDLGKKKILGKDEEALHTEASFEEAPQYHHYQRCANSKCNKLGPNTLHQSSPKKSATVKIRSEDEYNTDEEEDCEKAKGAWIECETWSVTFFWSFFLLNLVQQLKLDLTRMLKPTSVSVYHYKCLSSPVQKTLKAQLDSEQPESQLKSKKRAKVEIDVNNILKIEKCTSCEKPAGTTCFVCGSSGKLVTDFERSHHEQSTKEEEDVKMEDAKEAPPSDEIVPGLMFRCQSCKRAAHYGCLDQVQFDDAETTFVNHTLSYFIDRICHDCFFYEGQSQLEVDAILGWKPTESSKPPEGEKVKDQNSGKEFILPNAKDSTFPAQYLIKWKGWSYRDLDWVTHSWLSTRYQSRVSYFLANGSTVSFEPSKEELGEDTDDLEIDAKEAQAQQEVDYPLSLIPGEDIEDRVPQAWKTVDRVIGVTYKSPVTGEFMSFEDFSNRPLDDRESVKYVHTAYLKWCGLPYSQSTEQTPPKEGEPGYEAFFKAYQGFIVASQPQMRVPQLPPSAMLQLDAKRKGTSPVLAKQPDTIKNGQLRNFQLEGLNFLIEHWWKNMGCMLADEMGLGKTCQLITFLSYLSSVHKARPFLIIVPNSLVSNWLREFDQWAPELRTVAYNGDAESRRIVEQFEMFADNGDLKTHVVITTYEAVKANSAVFARCSRWECVVIDEGQVLKGGGEKKLWQAIDELRTGMKVLLTGTPLNNNLKELYNLLNFLAPEKFADVNALGDPTLTMDNKRVAKIRTDLRPYMLRRTKTEVLDLPPVGEFVIPVSLTLLQRQLYRALLEKNCTTILSVVKSTRNLKKEAKTGATTNILMALRKIVCHPYLHIPQLDPTLDPRSSVTVDESFRQLTDASAKLLLLEQMLPKLREKGHKVLIFSQFKIVLDKIGPFLDGLKIPFLRLDGTTPQLERQRDVDRFNDPNSPYSVFILSTRAGGVGLTLTGADVVIIFDQDFNPFQDMQAIARAHRIGQKNPVRVFRLVVKGTCEEKILASGRKKQGLEHLIVESVNAPDDNVGGHANVLHYGAQAILETDDAEAEKAAQRYTEAEIDELLSETAASLSQATEEGVREIPPRVWNSEKGGLGDVSQIGQAVEAEEDLGGFWDRIVVNEAEKEAEKAIREEAESGGRSRRARKPRDRFGFA
ncbi:hypothetical protein JCM3765_006830 [Sporobolomyces pararoseus]